VVIDRTWISELVWRDFYRHILFAHPRVCKYKAYKADTDSIPWSYDKDLFQKWCEGQTGYPIVDAGMRQLNETGWMHNRLRMIVAMFLTKHLLIDWRWGEKYFMQNLIDGDFASNNGGWQWARCELYLTVVLQEQIRSHTLESLTLFCNPKDSTKMGDLSKNSCQNWLV
jgi:deoxyribodipyrimidine photolyase